ncbi:MAG TPA: hypothetical protein DEB35_06450 [Desulfuromonas sp.]|nr:hypothetical protein [Desulfuromonas sp.]
MENVQLVGAERVERSIALIRGQRVLLDGNLAELYGVSTKVLNQAVKRNQYRFPLDFMFQLIETEASAMRSQIVTASAMVEPKRSHIATASRRNVRYLPYAFTEHGVK